MNTDRMRDAQSDGIEQIEDLAIQQQDAERVRGGFDPQPDPPCVPPWRPPATINPVIIRY